MHQIAGERDSERRSEGEECWKLKKEGGTEESERREGYKDGLFNITLQLKCIVNTNTATASCKSAWKGIQRDIIRVYIPGLH